jgi:hypothetical protein
VWVTTAHPKGHAFYLVGLDAGTGRTVHDLKLFEAANPTDISQYNSYASPTPCIDSGKVYAHFGSFGTACVDAATGRALWSRTDLPCDHWRGPASSPVVYRNWLYLLFDGYDRQYVACLDKTTGVTVWQKDRDLPYPDNGDLKKAFATPSVLEVGGKPQLVAPAAVGTVAYDPATGAELWKVIHGGMNEASRPVAAHGLVFVTTGHLNGLVAVRPGTGDVTRSVAWKYPKGAPTRPSPLVSGDHLYMVSDTGVAVCLDARTGAERWKERLEDKFSASPVLAGGNLYFAGEGGKTFVVAAAPEYRPVAVNKLAAGCRASPAVTDGALYLRTLTHLYRIGK